jgi:hypothetical protein
VAELAYASDLKSEARRGLWVRFPPVAPTIMTKIILFEFTYTPLVKDLHVDCIKIYVKAIDKEEALAIADDHSPLFDSRLEVKEILHGFRDG